MSITNYCGYGDHNDCQDFREGRTFKCECPCHLAAREDGAE